MSSDKYALGMTEYNEADFDSSPELDAYQYGLFSGELSGKALEVGAGAGRISKLALTHPKLEQLVISEPSDHFFKFLAVRIPESAKTKVIQGESSQLASQFPGHFDCIYSVDVMEHIENDRAFLGDCYRMLKPGGSCILLVPALQLLYSNFDKSIGHYRRYSKGLIRETVADTGFQIQRMSYHNLIGVLASLYFIKFRKLDYQTPENKKQFFFLAKIYSKFVIPVVRQMERILPVPFGLNLTVVLKKT